DADAVHAHLARHVGQHLVTLVRHYTEHRVGQGLDHHALDFDRVFVAHGCRVSPFIGVLDGHFVSRRATRTGVKTEGTRHRYRITFAGVGDECRWRGRPAVSP